MACCRRSRTRNQTPIRVFNQNNFIFSSVQVNNPSVDVVPTNEEIIFSQVDYNTGVSFSQQIDELGVNIVASGVYKISFSGNITSATDQTITIAISLNGTPLLSSKVEQFTIANQVQNVTVSTIFKVISPPAEIGVINLNEEFSVSNAKLDIVRIGNF